MALIMTPKTYFDQLHGLLTNVAATDDQGRSSDLAAAMDVILQKIQAMNKAQGKIIFIGNGGSAGIASHQAVDYWKNGKIRATAFNDASLLTCVGNDYGYAHVFEKPIEMFAQSQDILFAISSSGQSENILRGVGAAKKIGCQAVTFSGFAPENPLRALGDINFYVASQEYGPVEISHLTLSHYLLDYWMHTNSTEAKKAGHATCAGALSLKGKI